jgi:hypothetical protein
MMRFTRRYLFSGLVAALGITALRPVWARIGVGGMAGGDRGAAFATLFSDPDAAREIGARFLANAQDHHETVRAFASMTLAESQLTGGPLAMIVRHRIMDDFARGQVVVQDGWVLSRSELCACATLVVES